MNYQNFSREDFVKDSYFRKWVQKPDELTRQFWYDYLTKYPEQTETIRQAAEMILQLATVVREQNPVIPSEEIEHSWQEINHRITHPVTGVKPFYRQRWVWASAACLAFLISWAGYWYARQDQSYQHNVAHADQALKEWVNTTDHVQTIALQDGSSVLLHPGSRLSYPQQFKSSKREVFLSGEAFFEVAKNPKQPFFVYANEIVTKVLGTSFKVSAFPKDQKVTVMVQTGRVSVYAQSDQQAKEKAESTELEGLVLTPNQQIVYSREQVRMVKSLVTQPSVLAKSASSAFVFRNASVKDVFSAIEKAYGVHIIYDEDTFRHCQLNADLSDEPLYQKMEIITKSIEARYQVVDAQFVISGEGCSL
ncbi:FecR family protein [Siphonobacter sp. SORGH_AS_1065]|uniref:FecR family protein n=1 Tax=Siphonobacter sp. SORGH_AS_1065 TaxID=3041795 RepID=UPI002782CC52|nr:FecR family protein [Siphonobacter sp. SORGH_AS_1065]MDQ1086523.1 transmembrane sensor [Siphonobacter sp. SORGH_AS_1065]